MSLFQARDWWSAPSDAEDEYAPGCMCTYPHIEAGDAGAAGDVTASGDDDLIVTGSLGGVLRVWKPRARQSSGASASAGVVASTAAGLEDLQLEERLGAPILQIAAGRFSSASNGYALAVLHSKSLAVYTLAGASSTALKAVRLYEHVFATCIPHFTAFNMTFGPFGGGVPGSSPFAPSPLHPRDSIAVQSADGNVAVFEQEKFSFARAVEGVLIPGPIAYVPRTDSILIMTSDMCLESYKYATLAGAWASDASSAGIGRKESDPSDATRGPHGDGRKLRADWSINLGEHAHSIVVGGRYLSTANFGTMSSAAIPTSMMSPTGAQVPTSTAPSDIVVVGERTMFVLRDTGGPASVLQPGPGSPPSGVASPATASPTQPTSGSAIRLQKRLPSHPAAACLFVRNGMGSASHQSAFAAAAAGLPGAPATLGFLLATHNPALQVYAEENLLWAARLPYAPVAVAVGRFAGVGGLIATLSPRGDLTVSYLGTDPPTGSITGGETVRDLDYASMDAEHKKLLATIKDIQASAAGADKGVANQKLSQEGLLLRAANVPTSLDEPTGHGAMAGFSGGAASGASTTYYDDDEWGTDERLGEWGDTTPAAIPRPQPTLTAAVAFQFVPPMAATAAGTTPTCARDVHIAVHTPPWVLLPARLRSFVIPEISAAGGTLRLPFRSSRHGVPAGTQVRIVAQYSLGGARAYDESTGEAIAAGELRSSTLEFSLPLCLAARVIPPVKTAAFKFTIDTNRGPPPLTDVFADMLLQPRAWLPPDSVSRITATGAAVMSFLYRSGADVSILVSKAGGRYRIQAGSLEALCLIAQSLVERLARYFTTGPGVDPSQPPFVASYTEPLPLGDYFAVVDEHFAARRALLAAYSTLNDRAHEYRLVTKRLLVRAKDRAPPPLTGLDVLMEQVQANVLSAVNDVSKWQDGVAHAAERLAVCSRLLVALLAWKCGLDERSVDLLARALPASVVDTLESGWEETADAAITHYLKALTRSTGVGAAAMAAAGDFSGATADDVAANASAAGGGAAATATAAVTAAGGAIGAALSIPDTTARLKQHLTILIDRLQKGSSLSAGMNSIGPAPTASTLGGTLAAGNSLAGAAAAGAAASASRVK